MSAIYKSEKGKTYLAIGLMSGTSVDGVDAALVRFTIQDGKFEEQLLEFVVHPFPGVLREKLFALFNDRAGSLRLACEVNFEVGKVFARAAQRVIRSSGFPPEAISVIGSHGQTVYHIPPKEAARLKSTPSTLQLGEASIIAQQTGILVASDFRTADIAAGGNGAPLISTADFYLLTHPEKTRIVQNIGGIANCTYLPAGARIEDVLAFDTGPGNMVIDGIVSTLTKGKEHRDRGGVRARRGCVNERLLASLLENPYFRQRPPKTTGREKFGADYVKRIIAAGKRRHLSPDDIIATVTLLTVESIIMAYEKFCYPRGLPQEVILGGGGAKNRFMVNELRAKLPPEVKLLTHESLGINSKAKEAVGFALLGLLCLLRRPGNIPAATGANKAVLLGKLYYPTPLL